MFRFEELDYLLLLAVVPALIVIFWLSYKWRNIRIAKLINNELQYKLTGHISNIKRRTKQVFLLLSIAFLAIAWANPQWGNKKEKVLSQSADIFILFDISQSMMAKDVSPSRLERSKRFASNLVENLKGNRIGLILFAGEAYLQMPLTSDFAATEIFIKTANPDQATTQGTVIGDALKLAVKAFEEDNKNHKMIIIISDGEDHDENAVKNADDALEQGIIVYTIGVGTEEGDFIPVNRPNGAVDFKRDENGQLIKSQFNESLLNNIANSGGGKYYSIFGSDLIIDDLKLELQKLDKREIEQKSFTDYASYFQYFLFFAIIFLFIEFILSERKKINNQNG